MSTSRTRLRSAGWPTFATFLPIAAGWALCRSKPTVTNLVCTIGTSLLGHAVKHWTAYERFCYRSAWLLEHVSQLLLSRVVGPLVRQCSTDTVIDLAIDDTTVQRHGKHVAYAGYFTDASASNTVGRVVHWAHNWVVACVSQRPKRWPNWVVGLPGVHPILRGAVNFFAPHGTADQLHGATPRGRRRCLSSKPRES